jgi:uncharacterized protein YbaA (DUF1428 family)
MDNVVRFKETLRAECYDKDGNLKWVEEVTDDLPAEKLAEIKKLMKEKQNDN